MWWTLICGKRSLQDGVATARSRRTRTFLSPFWWLSNVQGVPTNPRSWTSQSESTLLKSLINLSDLREREKCSLCHIASLKSPAINHGSDDLGLIRLNMVHMRCLSLALGS